MPRAYSLDLRYCLIDVVEAGSSARAAARRLQVSASTAGPSKRQKRSAVTSPTQFDDQIRRRCGNR